jgi:hypothetical protein
MPTPQTNGLSTRLCISEPVAYLSAWLHLLEHMTSELFCLHALTAPEVSGVS